MGDNKQRSGAGIVLKPPLCTGVPWSQSEITLSDLEGGRCAGTRAYTGCPHNAYIDRLASLSQPINKRIAYKNLIVSPGTR